MSKVMVLDDNEVMRNVIRDIVSFMGHEVETYDQIETFIQEVKKHTPQYIIVDAQLQDRANGLDVIEKVRQLPGMQSSRCILMSANPALNHIRTRLRQREIKFLPKPCSFEELETALV